MSIFNFVKSAGQKIAAAVGAADSEKAMADHLRKLDLGRDDLRIETSGGKVKVSGTVASQAEREKIAIALGNIDGVEEVEDDITVEDASAPASEIYTVQRGDTLSAISKRFYGSASQYMRIFEANKPMLTNPDRIYPGQALRIPPKD